MTLPAPLIAGAARAPRLAAWLGLLLLSAAAGAVIETYQFSSPELERRYRQLSRELRCPQCQNQNIADSNAPVSQDLRRLLYRRLEAGATNDEILADMVARYGEFVRYRPSRSGPTLWLWIAPLALLLAGISVPLLLFRRTPRRAADAPPALSDEERRRLAAVLDPKARKSR